MTLPATDRPEVKKPGWPILFLIMVAGGFLSYFTQHLIEGQLVPACKISDAFFNWTHGLNLFVGSHELLADAMMIFYSVIGDTLVLFLIVCAIVKSSIRPLLPILIFMILRQILQMLVSFPVDPGIIWHYPGFPSLFQDYKINGDFYFSAYVGINILGALEVHELFRKRWLILVNLFLALVMAFIDIALRTHYTTDIYTSIMTAIFCYLFTSELVPPIDRFLKKLDHFSHFLLIFLICLSIAVFFLGQYFISLKTIPVCGIYDALQHFFSPINQFLTTHTAMGNGALILMNFLLDCMFIFMVIDTIITRNIRPFLTYALFFILRQTLQLLIALPLPPNIIWHYPGFPSLLQNYNIVNDLYFSGHAGISLIAALEMASFGKKWLTGLGFSIFIFESLMVIAMQIHYTMDVFTAIVTVFCITDLSIHLSHPINRFFAKIMPSR